MYVLTRGAGGQAKTAQVHIHKRTTAVTRAAQPGKKKIKSIMVILIKRRDKMELRRKEIYVHDYVAHMLTLKKIL
jgi:hypothetical protein